MINFAKLSRVPPKRRMAAALRGFGFGDAQSTAQHLRGLGLTRVSDPVLTRTVAVAAPPPASVPPPSMPLPSPRLPGALPRLPGAGSTIASARTVPIDPASMQMPTRSAYVKPALAIEPERSQVEDRPSEWSYGEGRQEDSVPPAETEEAGPDWSSYAGGEGSSGAAAEAGGGGTERYGSAVESVPTSAERAKAIKSVVGSAVSAQGGGLVAKVSALPMPVKVIGGIALAYVVWQVIK